MTVFNCEFCTEYFSKNDLNAHLDRCKYKPIECDNGCGGKFYRLKLNQHKTHECIKRIVLCRHCNQRIKPIKISSHLKVCANYNGSISEDHSNDSQHSDEAMECEFQSVGCPFVGKYSEMKRHSRSSYAQHLRLLGAVIEKQNCQLIKSEHMLKKTQIMMAKMGKKMNGMSENLSVVMEDSVQHTERLTDVEERMTQFYSHLTSLQYVLSGSTISKHGVLVWKIEDWSLKMAKEECEKPVFSHWFYFHGYRLQAVIFPNGILAGAGTHISVFLQILPGDYDSSLAWPFRESLTITLLDKWGDGHIMFPLGPENYSEISTQSLQRPNGERIIPFGVVTFATHQQINRNQFYIDEDALLFNVK